MGRGERGARGRICNPLPGGIGHHPAGTTTGMRGARCTGTVVRFSGAGNAREWCMILPGNRHPLFRIMHCEAQGLRLPVEAAVQDRTLRTAPRKHGLVPGLGDQLSPWPEPQWDAERRARSAERAPRCERGFDDASLGVPLPLLDVARMSKAISGSGARGKALEKMVAGKLAREQKSRRETGSALSFRPRDSGGGGPREAWWRGLLTRRFVVVERIFDDAGAPSTIRSLRARMVPLPRYRGAGRRWRNPKRGGGGF